MIIKTGDGDILGIVKDIPDDLLETEEKLKEAKEKAEEEKEDSSDAPN